MKLYIRQKVFSWRDRFTVWDESGAERWYATGEFFSWGRKLHVTDTQGREALFIRQKVWSFLPRYFIYTGEQQIATIVKEFTFLRPRYRIEGLNWRIDGTFWAHDYTITDGDRTVVSIHKRWMTWGDCYEMDITDPADELPALAAVLTIDCVLASETAAAASASN